MEHTIVSAIRFALDVGLKSTVLLALALALLVALRRYSAAGRHMIAMLALAGALVLPLLALWGPASRVSVPLLPEPVAVKAVRVTSVASGAFAAGTGSASEPTAKASDHVDVSMKARAEELSTSSLAAGAVETKPSGDSESGDAAAVETASLEPIPVADAAVPAVPAAAWRLRVDRAAALIAIWAAGALFSLARLAFGSWKIRAIARAAEPLCDREWRAAARELAARLSVAGRVRLLMSPEVSVAMTAGVRRPVLLLHTGARKWAADRRRVVLLHELAHIRRRDWVSFLLAELAVAIYWFHPLAWLARREARTSAERACDDLVLEQGTKPSVYAAHLLGIVRSLKPGLGGALPVLAMARPSQFEGRMRAILNPGLQRRGPSRGQIRGAALGLFSAVLVLGALQPWAHATAAAVPAGFVAVDEVSSDDDSGVSSPKVSVIASRQEKADKSEKAERSDKSGKGKPAKKPCPGKTVHAPGPVPASAPTDVVAPATPSGIVTAAASGPAVSSSPSPAVPPGPAVRANGPESSSESGIVSAVSSFVRALSREAPATARPATAPAPRGLVLAGKGRHRSGSEWYSKGMELHHDEQFDEAIAAFQKAIEEGYKEDASTYNIACGYALKGDKDRAFEWLRKANELGFNVSKYWSDDDLDSLHSDPRWAALRKELRDNPSSGERAERKRASDRLQKLISDPKAPGSRFFESGKSLYKTEEYAGSAKAYHRAAELGYRAGTASYNEACSLSLNGDKAAALDALQRAIENGFDQPDMFRTDDDLDAIRGERRFKELRTLAEELEGPSVSWEGHIFKSEQRYQWRKAADHAREVAAKHPQYGRVWYNLGYAEIKGERPEAAAAAFQKALDMGYRKPTTLYNLACSYSLMGQKDKAFDYLFKAVEAGFDEYNTMRHDDDLDNIRGDARYEKALKLAEAKDAADDDDN